MPYAQATILEILRHGSIISPGERIAVEDNTIDGTFYPKILNVVKSARKHYLTRVNAIAGNSCGDKALRDSQKQGVVGGSGDIPTGTFPKC